MGEHQGPRAIEVMAIVVRPKEVGGAFSSLKLLDVVVFFELPQTGKFQSTLWSLSSTSVLPVKDSAKTIMRITGRIVAGDALMVLLVELVAGPLGRTHTVGSVSSKWIDIDFAPPRACEYIYIYTYIYGIGR